MADGSHLENQNLRYLQYHLADYDEILHDDTYIIPQSLPVVQKSNFSKCLDFLNC